MLRKNDGALDVLIRKLERLAPLDRADRSALATLPVRVATAPAGHVLVRDGEPVDDCCVLIEGYACRHKMLADGRRQIVSFHLPGDALDLQHLLLARADHNVQTITAVKVAWVPGDALRRVAAERPVVGAALWRDTLIDASVFREWVLNVGQRGAKARVAHMLCEFAVRRENAGIGSPERFELPMTQEHIADATGLTAIHVNRMLQALGGDGVIDRDRRRVTITDWGRMRAIAEFDPGYVHLAR